MNFKRVILMAMINKIGKWCHLIFLLLFCFVLIDIIAICLFTKYMWGSVNLPQLLFFMQMEGGEVDQMLIYSVIVFCVIIPLCGALGLLLLCNKYAKETKPFVNRLVFLCYLYGLFFAANWVLNLSVQLQYLLYWVLFVFYLLNQGRCLNKLSLWGTMILAIPLVYLFVCANGYRGLFLSAENFEETDFYEKHWASAKNLRLNADKKRNLIIIFGESLEKRFTVLEGKGDTLKFKDEKAVKFSDFMEGYAQRWTQGALFSAFTGAHIHYLSDFYRYEVFDKIKYDERAHMLSNKVGTIYDFETPNIAYLGDITAQNGYQNLFVQGGDAVFSGTMKFLENHGFSSENIYDKKNFEGNTEYYKADGWWGINDREVFKLFKQKILSLDKNKPFLAVMFTLDLHRGDNPYFEKEEDIRRDTINNLNSFVEWFENQDFYKDTTLVVLADHKRMGAGVQPGGGLYNAFFNLPKDMVDGVEAERAFNQIDMFPTFLDIMGFSLPKYRAGMGVSLFSAEKTLAEKYSYEEQENIFLKIDRFYQALFGKKELFSPFKQSHLLKERLIAHAGGVIDGVRYTNSLEAAESSAKRGYKYIEFDLLRKDTGGGYYCCS